MPEAFFYMTDVQAIHRAQLADMPPETIEAWLREQGWVLRPAATHGPSHSTAALRSMTIASFSIDRLPRGYPPLADGEEE